MAKADPSPDEPFTAEVARVRASGALGDSGRLLELFNFLAGRGPETTSASQAEIAEMVEWLRPVMRATSVRDGCPARRMAAITSARLRLRKSS